MTCVDCAGDCGCAGVNVTTPAAVDNPPGGTALRYRTGTHGDFVSSMLARLSSPAHPALAGLTVRSTDDPAIAMLDGWACVADVLTFYAERIANEGYLRTATEQRSLQLLGRLVGHLPRPGVSAGTFLAYVVDRDPSVPGDTRVTIPAGARAQSVPAEGEQPQPFETAEDLPARSSWNDLGVRLRRPYQITRESLDRLGRVHLAGTATDVRAGDRLLFVFGTEPGRQVLRVVPRVTIDQGAGATVAELDGPPLPGLADLAAAFRALVDLARTDEGMYDRSRIVQRYVDDHLNPIAGDLPFASPTAFGGRLDTALQRLAETVALARPYANVRRWLAGVLQPAVAGLRAAVAALEPPQPPAAATTLHAALRLDEAASPAAAAIAGLGALLGALRVPPARPPAGPRQLDRDPARLFAPGSDVAVQLLAALDERLRDGLYPALREVGLTAPPALAGLQAMRTVATPFGATAPLRPETDDQGKVTGYVDWPLRGTKVLTGRVVFGTRERVELTFTEEDSVVDARREFDDDTDEEFDFGPGRVRLTVQGVVIERAAELGVTLAFRPELPARRVFVSRPDGDNRVHVVVDTEPADGSPPLDVWLAAGGTRTATHQGLQVRIAREDDAVRFTLTATLAPSSPNVIALDAVYDGIGPGSWVVIQRPGKDGPLAEVITRVRSARVVSRAAFGITGKVTELVLDNRWLDERDQLLSDIRQTTVYARGEPLSPASEPVPGDVGGAELELARLHDGLAPGRWVVVTGERTDLPETPGIRGTELNMIAAVRQGVDENRPGDQVHTTVVLATPLAYRYRRDTVVVHANVAPATHGATRDEPIGSGDAGLAHQTFRLFQGPLTWLAADTPRGARSTLEIRVDGVRWHEVDSLAGRGPGERVYTSRTDPDGRTSVTFGDGEHGARLPTGYQNVRARYRVGTGRAGNVGAGRITQLLTRPLWVSAVHNPLPATGGADPDDAEQARRGIPLSVTALDRLLSVPDYADFARLRAGIGRAAARRLFDGARQIVHVTVAGADDIPLTADAGIVRSLHTSLATFGDPHLPVVVAVRELVLLVIAANVRVLPDHSWELVEPAVRAALLDRLGFDRRELGQPAYLSEAVAAMQAVAGVEHVDVDVFAGVPAGITPAGLAGLADRLTEAHTVVSARPARFAEERHEVPAGADETLTAIAARAGRTIVDLLRLNPGLTDAGPVRGPRSLVVFRGVRPAQLALLSPAVPDTLILKEVRS